jgi:pimeloyl-ACP methyl ester carboxylesterase
VLVGHSYGGAVVTDTATGNTDVNALVYIDAYIPDDGQNVSGLSTSASAQAPASTNPASVFSLIPSPGAPSGIADTYLLPGVLFKDFAPDIPRTTATVLEAGQSPTSLLALVQPSGLRAWRTIASWDVVGNPGPDHPPRSAQLAMAGYAGAHVFAVTSPHRTCR